MKQIWMFREGQQLFVTYADTSLQIQAYWNELFGVANRFIRIYHTCETCNNKRNRDWCNGQLGGCDCDCHVYDWREPIELSPTSTNAS